MAGVRVGEVYSSVEADVVLTRAAVPDGEGPPATTLRPTSHLARPAHVLGWPSACDPQ